MIEQVGATLSTKIMRIRSSYFKQKAGLVTKKLEVIKTRFWLQLDERLLSKDSFQSNSPQRVGLEP